MKKYYILITTVVFLASCQPEQAIKQETNKDANIITTASKNQVENYLTKLGPKTKSKGGLEILTDELSYEVIGNSNEKLAVIPIQTNKPNVTSRLLVFNIEDKTAHVLFHKIVREGNSSEFFTGILRITNIEGEFIDGFRVENGKLISQFILIDDENKNSECDEDYNSLSDDFCDQNLAEVVITVQPQQPVNSTPLNGLYETPDYNELAKDIPYWHYGPGYTLGTNVEEKIDDSALEGKEKCLNDLLDKEGDSYVQDLLGNFRGESEFDIKIESKDQIWSPESQKYITGRTFPPEDNTIKIEISSGKASSRSALSVARTILHEYIHADIFRKLNTQLSTSNVLDFKTTFEQYESDQHEIMGDLYVRSMTNSLKKFHKEVLTEDYNAFTNYYGNPPSDSFYEAIAWQGLKNHNVKAYTELSQNKKDAIAEEEQKLGILKNGCPQN